MNNTLLIRMSAIAAVSLVALVSTAAAGHLPRPLGAGEQPLSAGVHVLDLASLKQARPGYKHLPRIAVTLPSGWFNNNGWAVNNGGALGLGFWDPDKVYPTGCHWQGKPKIDPGRTVAGLARVLATRPLRHASRPRNAELAGFRGKYLKWSVPSEINISRCSQGYFESWTGRGWATDRWQQGAGQVDRLWILDLNGKRLVIDANYLPSATRKQRADLDRVVHSIRFVSASPRKPASTSSGRKVGDGNGNWIAYSTGPGRYPSKNTGGSDVFVKRVIGRPVLVAGRDGEIRNMCPVFSPNGRMLAFAREARAGSAIVVVRVGPHGPMSAGRRILKVPGGRIRCPRWSSDSSRVAYLDRGRIVVRGLDGSRPHRSAGDPTIQAFHRSTRVLVSPDGHLIASLTDKGIVVSLPDGSDHVIIKDDPPSYAIAGWSPDGRRLLVMRDVGGGFEMRAALVPAPRQPSSSRIVVAYVRVNNARSWPGYGDVSWQPRPRR